MMKDIQAYDAARSQSKRPCNERRHHQYGHMASTSWALLRQIHSEIDPDIKQAVAAEASLNHVRQPEA